MSFTNTTFMTDILKFIRDGLLANITDPNSASRVGREKFVVTLYPERNVKYPLISVMHRNISQISRLGQQSEGSEMLIPVEVRVWAENETQKTTLVEQVINYFRTNQFGTGSSTEFELHDFKLVSSVDVDENGDGAPKSKVMDFTYMIILI